MITRSELEEKGACDAGLAWFDKNFPTLSAKYEEIHQELENQGQTAYIAWLEREYKLVYTYDELSASAQERAREYFVVDEFDHSCLLEEIEGIARLLGIFINSTSGGVYIDVEWDGEDATYSGYYEYAKNAVKKVEQETKDPELVRIAKELRDVQRPNFYRLQASISYKRWSRSRSIIVSVEDALYPYRSLGEYGERIKQALEDFGYWIGSRLRSQEDFENSEESLAEQAREFSYDVDGNFIE
jgi:hypothetical protein